VNHTQNGIKSTTVAGLDISVIRYSSDFVLYRIHKTNMACSMHLQDAEEPVHRNNNTSCIQRIKTLIKTHKCSDPKDNTKKTLTS